MKNANLAEGLDLYMQIGEDEEMDVEFKEAPKKDKDCDRDKDKDRDKDCKECHVPPMKINCDLEVGVGTKNKIIYVCPGKVQYFTATAIKCSGDEKSDRSHVVL